MKLKAGYLKDTQKLIDLYHDSSRKKKERPKPVKSEMKVTTDTTEMRRITRGYFKQLCTNKMDNLEGMNKVREV